VQGYFFWRTDVNYIIFDFEWNNAYSYAAHNFMNEIIEIGAVKLDEKLNIVDTFKQMITPSFTKKLSSRCKNLTKITNEELRENGVHFNEAFYEFKQWSAGDDNVFMSWSNSDLYVLSANFLQYKGNCRVDFIHAYCDVQKYCMSFVQRSGEDANNQISLAHCAEIFEIDVDAEKFHRALADCYVTAECLKTVYDKEKLKKYIQKCDINFFERLMFKPYYITEFGNTDFDFRNHTLVCPSCGNTLKVAKEVTVQNKSFKAAAKCKKCKKTFWTFTRAKKTYDDVIVKTHFVEMNRKRARRWREL